MELITSAIINNLDRLYPSAGCSLNWKDPWQLVVMTRLSAQCTDARVNSVSKELFAKYPTCAELAAAEFDDVFDIVSSCGLGATKAHDTIQMCKRMIELGGVPMTQEELLRLPGVGLKTANLVRNELFGGDSIVPDTHCIRVSNRLGLVDTGNAIQVALELDAILPAGRKRKLCHQLIALGREWCTAKNPGCLRERCPMQLLCRHWLDSRSN